ncbi:type II toxin-antitoxin system Phd/YefM family antitoxin [Trueperella bialowiezensis]|uniref:Antitoxin n=1 Tax=Trueperella bialowiezensis TaxID=312285 RepID=A0A3S4V7N4_9ACTO|nr:type II toxin-antitoxin system prevent-host-death family antitoxin [Trueperella bialowiezensis]VEI13831.1 Antitoxin VapB47 [Trueperella bialowiezensis]
MDTISHYELRNYSSKILRRVEAGESFVVTDNGRAVARVIPAPRSPIDRDLAAGVAIAARREPDFDSTPLVDGPSTVDILNDIRRDY